MPISTVTAFSYVDESHLFFVPTAGDKLFGLVDKDGNLIVAPKYKELRIPSDTKPVAIAAQNKDGQWGYIKPNGEILYNFTLDDALSFTPDGLAAVKKGESWGFLKLDGSYLIEPSYSEVESYSFGLAAVKQGELWSYIDSEGKAAFDGTFTRPRNFNETGLAPAINSDNKLWGIINKKGEWVVKPQFNFADELSKEGHLPVKQDKLWGLIDSTGEWLIEPKYKSIDGYDKDNNVAFYSIEPDRGGIMNSGGEILVDSESRSLKDFTLHKHCSIASFRKYDPSYVSFYDLTNGNPLEELDKGKYRKITPFNSECLSVANLGDKSSWGRLNSTGELFRFDKEVIEPFFISPDRWQAHKVANNNAYWIPALTSTRDLVYIDSKGKIGLRTEVETTANHDTFIVTTSNGDELWRQQYPSNSLTRNGEYLAFLNLSDKELGYQAPTKDLVAKLVTRLKEQKPSIFDNVTATPDEGGSSYGTSTNLARGFYDEVDWPNAFDSIVEQTVLTDKFNEYEKVLISLYGQPIQELDDEAEAALEDNEFYADEQAIWFMEDHYLILFVHHEELVVDDVLNLVLLPNDAAKHNALGSLLLPYQNINFSSTSSEPVFEALKPIYDAYKPTSIYTKKAVVSVLETLKSGNAISHYDYLRMQRAITVDSEYDEELIISNEEDLAFDKNTIDYLQAHKLGEDPLTMEGQFKIDVYRHRVNAVATYLQDSDPEQALGLIEPAMQYVSYDSSFLYDTYVRALLNSRDTEKAYTIINKVLTDNPLHYSFHEYYEDSDFLKWRNEQSDLSASSFEEPTYQWQSTQTLNANKNKLALSSYDQVKVIDLSNGNTIFTAKQNDVGLDYFGFNTDGNKLIASGTLQLNIWDINSGKLIVKQALDENHDIHIAGMTNDSQRYFYQVDEGYQQFDGIRMKEISQDQLFNEKTVFSIDDIGVSGLSTDGNLLAFQQGISDDASIVVLNLNTARIISRILIDDFSIFGLYGKKHIVNKNQHVLARGSDVFYLLNIEDQKLERSWDTNGFVDRAAVTDDFVVAFNSDDFQLRIWNFSEEANEQNTKPISLELPAEAKGEILHVCISDDRKHFAVMTTNELNNLRYVFIIDAQTYKTVGRYVTDNRVYSIEFANDDQYLVVDGYPIEVIDRTTFKPIHTFKPVYTFSN